MKQLLLLLTCFVCISASSQVLQNAPWMDGIDLNNRETAINFYEVVDAANAYFDTIDKDAKGSGYKPFKRWEQYWKSFVNSDGYLPSAQELWDTWEQVQEQRSLRDAQDDESNWTSIGLSEFGNRPTSTANIGRINVIIQDPNNANVLYAGAPSGSIWKSTDGGVNWIAKSDNLPSIGVSGIAVDYNDSNIIYIATGDDDHADTLSAGVFKSIDGGDTWQQTGLNPSNTPSLMNDIYIHPTNSNILWVATNSGVYKTTNAGTNWSLTLSGNIRDIKIKPGDPNTVYAVSSSSFYKSTNGGDSFVVSSTGLPASSGRLVIDVTPANPNVVYAVSATTGNGYQGIYKSTNSGDSFVQRANTTDIFESTQAWYDLALAVSPTNENEIYTGVLNIWKSTTGGDSFTQVNYWFQHTASFTHADIHFLRYYGNDLYCGSDGGFYRSSNGGTTFTDLTGNMEVTQFYRIDVSQQTSDKIVGGTQDNGGFGYFNQWNHYHGGDGMEGVIDPNTDNLYYGFMQFGQNLFISNNSGQSGSQAFGGPENGNWITPLSINSESEVYAGYSRVYQFNGSSFTPVSPSFGIDIDVLEIDPNEPDNMFVAVNTNLYRSTDRGVSFNIMETFPNNISSVEVNNNEGNIIYVSTFGTNGGVYRSTDNGATFTNITGTLPNITKNVIKHREDDPLNSLYLGTSLGVYRYDDNIGAWEEFNVNLPNVPVFDLAINIVDENITAGTFGRGIWRSNLSTTELANNDVRLVSVDNPIQNSFECGAITPQITVKNNGQNTINSIDITYAVDNGANVNFTWNGTLLSEETTSIDLDELVLSRGQHQLDVNVSITNDAFPSNNDSNAVFYINDAGIAQVVNTFETAAEELITFNEGSTSSLWERGVPNGTLLNTASSGTQVYGTNLNGNHTDNTKAYLFSQCYDLTAISNPILKFDMAFDIEFDWDLLYVEYTLDGGTSWSLLGSASDPNWYNSSRFAGDGVANNCFNCVGGQWTGTDATMKEYSYDLVALTNEPNVIFRVVFHSDQAVTEEGAIIDDFYVDGTLSTSDVALEDIAVYPNPSKDVFYIKMMRPGSEYNLRITDLTGQTILRRTEISDATYVLDMTRFSSGMYFLTIDMDGRSLTKKLIRN